MKKILVVEDEKNISKLIKDTLSLGKYEVECAFDGQEAVEKAKKEKFDLIILDLNAGADDYITKPFEPLELLARVELRISNKKNVFEYKDIVVNDEEKTVYKNGIQINLTPKEYELFLLLLSNIGVALSRETILDKVWGIDTDIETRTIDYHIQQLRKKLELKSEISTVNKIGYRIEKIN